MKTKQTKRLFFPFVLLVEIVAGFYFGMSFDLLHDAEAIFLSVYYIVHYTCIDSSKAN